MTKTPYQQFVDRNGGGPALKESQVTAPRPITDIRQACADRRNSTRLCDCTHSNCCRTV